jgi:RNA polymerase sigma-70 factor (ECF subfamily)
LDEAQKLLAEERVLIQRAKQGDRPAFAVLVERYWDRLFRWMYNLTHNRHAAEDLCQEAFLKALAGLPGFRDGSNFRAWLFRIAYNAFVNQARKVSRLRDAFPAQLADGADGPA